MDINDKYREIGLVATVLCQKHLENPKQWDATEILAKLFDKFEQLDLEEDIDGFLCRNGAGRHHV